MRNRLTDHIVDRQEGALCAERVDYRLRNSLTKGQKWSHQVARQVEHGVDVTDRCDQNVALEHGPVVQKRNQIAGTSNDRGGDITASNLAEHVGHRTIVGLAESNSISI